MLTLLFLLFSTDCKTVLLKQGDPSPCAGYLISPIAAEKSFDIVENLYPKIQEKANLLESKVSLLGEQLKVDNTIINSLKEEIVLYKKNVKELLEFGQKSLLEHDNQLKLQTVIVVVSVGVTIVLVVGAVVAVGYLARSFAPR